MDKTGNLLDILGKGHVAWGPSKVFNNIGSQEPKCGCFLQNYVNFNEAAQTLNVVNFFYFSPLSIYIAKLLLKPQIYHC